MYFVSFCSRFIDRFAPCVLFRSAVWAHQFTVTLTCTNANETVAIDVLVVVYNKTWENRVMLSLHGQLVLDIRPRCWLRMLKLTRLRLVNFYHPQSTSLPNIQHYLIMTRWITLQSSTTCTITPLILEHTLLRYHLVWGEFSTSSAIQCFYSTRYPLLLGGQMQHGMRSLPHTSTYDQQ